VIAILTKDEWFVLPIIIHGFFPMLKADAIVEVSNSDFEAALRER
jgi:hypothetical protein